MSHAARLLARALAAPFVALALLLPSVAQAAQWARSYGGASDDSIATVQRTADGGFVVGGSSGSFGPLSDVWVMRLAPSGSTVWQKTYTSAFGTTPGSASSIAAAPDGGFVAVGTASGFIPSIGTWPTDAWIMKLDPDGGVLWHTVLGLEADDSLSSVVVTADGGFVAVGVEASTPLAVKLDADGHFMWRRTYLSLSGSPRAVVSALDHGLLIAGIGYSVETDLVGTHFSGGGTFVLRLDAGGGVLWQKTYPGPYRYASAAAPTPDGGLVLVGRAPSEATTDHDAWVMKVDAGGNVVWEKTYGGSGDDIANSVDRADDGGYVVAGGTMSYRRDDADAWVLKVDRNGEIVWQQHYGGTHDEEFFEIRRSGDGGYVAVGYTTSFGAGGRDAWILKLDATGAIDGCRLIESATTVTSARRAAADVAAAGTAGEAGLRSAPGIIVQNTSAAEEQQCYARFARSAAIEYRHGGFDHYFVTASPAEIDALDAGAVPGWTRTGESFLVLGLDAELPNVCRFWSGQAFSPVSSHFYTPFDWECAVVQMDRNWQYEGDVFAMILPDAVGLCSSGTAPLYRLYNGGTGGAPNHRYTTSAGTRARMIGERWIPEGAGDGVVGCVPRQ